MLFFVWDCVFCFFLFSVWILTELSVMPRAKIIQDEMIRLRVKSWGRSALDMEEKVLVDKYYGAGNN